jgi:hypothetical protein
MVLIRSVSGSFLTLYLNNSAIYLLEKSVSLKYTIGKLSMCT